jgi:ATP-dependent helicase HrpB
VLYEAALTRWDQVFPLDASIVTNLLQRVRCLADWMPEQNLPKFIPDELHSVLQELCSGCRSLAELKRADWYHALLGKLSYPQQQLLEREAPEKIQVPSGSHITLTYEYGRPPVLAVRIQEVFGLTSTPRVGGGRIPVLMHLLAPNMRPQQVTDDLASFWANTYAEVRKELRRRYPKHQWPEDPQEGIPVRKPGAKPK